MGWNAETEGGGVSCCGEWRSRRFIRGAIALGYGSVSMETADGWGFGGVVDAGGWDVVFLFQRLDCTRVLSVRLFRDCLSFALHLSLTFVCMGTDVVQG